MKAENRTMRTSWTLVARIKNPDDQDSWKEFYDRYKGLLLGVAIKAGLRQEEAEDVLQATMAEVFKNIREFEADPACGSFGAWLLQKASWRIKDQVKKRLPVAAPRCNPSDATATTPTVERIPDPREVDLEELCDAEPKRWFREQVLAMLQLEVKAEHYLIFHLLTVEKKTIGEVSRMLGRNPAAIYVIKHRVTKALNKIVKRLEKERW